MHNINLTVSQSKSLAVVGPSGSGKTILGKMFAGLLTQTSGELTIRPALKRTMVEQHDRFISLVGQRSTYYGQRYENQEMENTPTIGEYLQSIAKKNSCEDPIDAMILMQIDSITDRKLLQLSNGERKRTRIAAALLEKPDLLILDQPFVGLDTKAHENLEQLLQKLSSSGISLILICDTLRIPSYISCVVEMDKGTISKTVEYEEWQSLASKQIEIPKSHFGDNDYLFSLLPKPSETFTNIVVMKNVNVTIGEKKILKDINWHIKSGEQWALQGHNGAGKTTLLSLVTADNPQGYVNDIVLFDCKRGSGESIWNIKKRIGYVSPELHLYFIRGEGVFTTIQGFKSVNRRYDSLSCLDVLLSGFNDEIGFVSNSTALQRRTALSWLKILQLEYLADNLFINVSFGEQRLLLLARALIKSPPLFILDEPCQGLDNNQIRQFTSLLDIICKQLNITMIYVTHLPREIPPCVTKLLQLEDGHVKYCGTF